MKARREALFDVRWDSFHNGLWWGTLDPNNYIGTFRTDVLEKVVQTIEVPPAEEVAEPGHVEDSLTAEFGVQVEDEQSIGDLDYTRNERLEAIEKEEALQAESWEEEIAAEVAAADEVPSEQEPIEDPVINYFRAFKEDQSGCGICNVSFGADDSENWQYPSQDVQREFETNDPVVGDNAIQLSDLSHRPVLRTDHLAKHSPHWKKVEQFEAYQKLFREELHPHLTRLENLFVEAQILLRTAEQQGKPLSILSTKVDEVIRANMIVTEVITIIQQQCNWADLASFKKAIMSFRQAFETCEEEIQLANTREAALTWNLDNEPDINDDQYAHVPGLRKKK
ncbi:hypothetical protein ACROYT_G032062 [Oculina patagonica]